MKNKGKAGKKNKDNLRKVEKKDSNDFIKKTTKNIKSSVAKGENFGQKVNAKPKKQKNQNADDPGKITTNGQNKTALSKSSAKVVNTAPKEKNTVKNNAANEIKQTSNDQETELSKKVLAKIHKKKEKRLAQKLRKKQKKTEVNKESKAVTVSPKDKTKKIPEKKASVEAKPADTTTAAAEKKAEKKNKKKLAKLNGEQKEQRPHIPTIEGATIFVGNLPTNTKAVQLMKHFKAYGPITKIRFRTAGGKVLFKHKVRKEAGTLNAYMQLKDAETAEKVVADLNGSELKGNHLRITLANEKQNKGNTKCMIFVGNLKYSANEEKLRDIFSSCGEIEYIRCLHDGEKGCKGVAYVTFKAPESVGLAMELNETILDERPIHVERYSEKKLGAKDARSVTAAAEEKTKTGAAKRLEKKKSKLGNKDKPKQVPAADKNESSKKNKKTEYRGVKVGGGIKKKQHKKKITSQMEVLAKKIAPKSK